MKRLRLYLETSVWNFLDAADAPEKMQITQQFFEELARSRFELFISELVIAEIERTPDEAKRNKLLKEINKYAPTVLDLSNEVGDFTQELMRAKMVAKKHENDAAHIAFAVVNELDLLVSWNMGHIVRLRTKLLVESLSIKAGYKRIHICTPEEVIGYD